MSNATDIDYAKRFGKRFREIRQSKKVTLNEISKQTGLTASFISQFERGLTTSSVASMQKIAQALHTPLASLFDPKQYVNTNNESVSLVRKSQREKVTYPAPASSQDYSLTNSNGKLQIIYTTIEPGGNSGEQYSHNGEEECIIVLSGIMEIMINDDMYVLNEGDTITFSSHSPHGWKNTGTDSLEALWIITPPSF